MELKHILGLLTFLIFLIAFHCSTNKRGTYFFIVLCLFPFIDLNITSERLGSISVFDGISYYVLLFFIRDFIFQINLGTTFTLLFSAFVIILLVGCFQSEFIEKSLINSIKYLSIFIYAKLFIDECNSKPQFVNLVIKYLKFVCLISVAFLAAQLIIGLQFSFYPDLNPNTYVLGVIRYPSFFQDSQIYAQFLAMACFLFLINTGGESNKSLLVNRIFFIILILVIFITGGRAGFLALCAGSLLILITGKSKLRLVIISTCLVVYLISIIAPDSFAIFKREEGLNDSFNVRYAIWTEAFDVFINNPLVGIGIGNYRDYQLKHSELGYYLIDNEVVYYGTESGYLKILAECGMLGFAVIFSFVLIPVITGLKYYFRKIVNHNVLYLIAAVFAWMMAFITSNTLDDKRIVVLLVTLLSLLIFSTKSENVENAY